MPSTKAEAVFMANPFKENQGDSLCDFDDYHKKKVSRSKPLKKVFGFSDQPNSDPP
jgi:hypothetical protein